MILDEPTSVLTPAEADEVLGMLHAMTRAGEVTVLMITHKFREVMAFADAVSVLRRGRLAGEGRVADLDAGAPGGDDGGSARDPRGARRARERPATPAARRAWSCEELVVDNDGGLVAVDRVSLAVRPGEIVGIAGVSGNGQRELVETLIGQRVPVSGQVSVDGATVSRDPRGHPRSTGRSACPRSRSGTPACRG